MGNYQTITKQLSFRVFFAGEEIEEIDRFVWIFFHKYGDRRETACPEVAKCTLPNLLARLERLYCQNGLDRGKKKK